MNKVADNRFSLKADDIAQFDEVLETQPWMRDVVQICSVPLRLTQPLVNELLSRFVPSADANESWQRLIDFGLVTLRNEDEWCLDPEARKYFLDKLEKEKPESALQVHGKLLEYLKALECPLDEGHVRLQQAYHTTPLDPEAGTGLYWSTYCRSHVSNRFAMLPVLAELIESQTHWLKNRELDVKLYRAAALYYEGTPEGRQKAAELLEPILEQGASASIALDACFLLGVLKEQTDHEKAIKLYEQAIELRNNLSFEGEDPDVQQHLRRTLAKSYFNLASILQTRGDSQALEKAEFYYRHGIQIVSESEPAYEATQLRRLIGILQRRGEKDKIESLSQRIGQIEDPFRQAFLTDAFSQSDDIGYLYYVLAALNHGFGYEHYFIRIEVERDGRAQIEGAFTLKALSAFNQIDSYLETVPESDVGVHFEQVESLTPKFTLDFRSTSGRDVETISIFTEPPLAPGDELAFRWRANASPGTFSTTPEQLAKAKFDCEHAAWEIIVPIKTLEMQVVIPCEPMKLPRVWFELWKMGTWRPAGQQAQTAHVYRTFLQNDPSRVRPIDTKRIQSDKLQITLEVNYPWLAMSYALAWEVL